MSSLRLRNRRTGDVHVVESASVLMGRAGECDLVISGPGSERVSGRHARIVRQGDGWVVQDAGGRNGTFVGDAPVPKNGALDLSNGQILTLGGPDVAFDVEWEQPPPVVIASLIHSESGERWEQSAATLRIGRSEECDICLVEDQRISRVHCEILPNTEGEPVLRDANSSHGTILDGEELTGEAVLRDGSRFRLGPEGPELFVEFIGVKGHAPRAAPEIKPFAATVIAPHDALLPAASEVAVEAPVAQSSRSGGSSGRTAFFRRLVHETEKKHASRTRGVVWSFVVMLLLAVGTVVAVSELRVRGTEAELASQRAALDATRVRADSIRTADLAEYRRLELELQSARDGSAPSAVVDSLRSALEDARARTAFLEQAVELAREDMTRQISLGDSIRIAQQAETQRLRSVLTSYEASGISAADLESLRAQVLAAEDRAAQLEAGMRAIRGTDLAAIAEANQEATGLVSVFAGEDIYDGSGFVVSRRGYFITNRHVASPRGLVPDSVHITMADQRTGHRARVVAVAPPDGPDLAVLRIPDYSGPFVRAVDWDGTRARQGEPAALIGFPAGTATALDVTSTVRTSMSAGIFSKVTDTQIQFDGFTIGGSSGSPIFNADGEVVAVHSSGLREAAGLGFAVPVRLVLPLLPDDARR